MSKGKGLEAPGAVDLITEASDGTIRLVISHDGPWTGQQDQLAALQMKVQNYLKFANDGQLARFYPEFASRKVTIRLYAGDEADDQTLALLERLTEQAGQEDVRLFVQFIRKRWVWGGLGASHLKRPSATLILGVVAMAQKLYGMKIHYVVAGGGDWVPVT